MITKYINKTALTATVALLATSGVLQANLLTNGTFDTDLSGWDTTGTTTGVTWISGTAHVGRPGTPGVANFSQFFDIPVGTPAVKVTFDYQWQVNAPAIPDVFTVSFSKNLGPLVSTDILSEDSNAQTFNTTIPFEMVVSTAGILAGPNNAEIFFNLVESNTPVGTRIQLDNVSITAVPEPGTYALLGAGLLCASFSARKRRVHV